MSPQDLERRAGALLGAHGWQSRLARATGYSDRMIRLYAAGEAEIPAAIEAAIELLELTVGAGLPAPRRWKLRPGAAPAPARPPRKRRASRKPQDAR